MRRRRWRRSTENLGGIHAYFDFEHTGEFVHYGHVPKSNKQGHQCHTPTNEWQQRLRQIDPFLEVCKIVVTFGVNNVDLSC